MSLVVSALLGSFWVRVVGAVFLGLVAFKGYGLARQLQGRVEGRAEVTQAVTAKADKDAQTSREVDTALAAGQGKAKNPYVRPE